MHACYGTLAGSPEEFVIKLSSLPQGAVPLTLVRVPAGSFLMGRYPDEPYSYDGEGYQHQVDIGYDFYIGKYELTQAQWQALMGTAPWQSAYGVVSDPNRPAVYFTWNELHGVNGLLDRLNALGQGAFRLPSEAEWEYACRAGTTTSFYWGEDNYTQLGGFVWHYGNASSTAQAVGGKRANIFGLFDMLGNVSEFCEDGYHSYYALDAPTDGSAWVLAPLEDYKTVRGGNASDASIYCRSAYRADKLRAAERDTAIGVRIVRFAE